MAIDWMGAIVASGLGAVFGRHLLKELSGFVSRCLDRRSVMRAWEHDHDRDAKTSVGKAATMAQMA
jgi:hypothetical protein